MPSCFHSHLRTQNICLIFIFFAQTGPLNLFVFFIKMVEFGIKLPRKSWYAVKTQNTITLQRKVIVACVRNDCEKNERKKKKSNWSLYFSSVHFFRVVYLSLTHSQILSPSLAANFMRFLLLVLLTFDPVLFFVRLFLFLFYFISDEDITF